MGGKSTASLRRERRVSFKEDPIISEVPRWPEKDDMGNALSVPIPTCLPWAEMSASTCQVPSTPNFTRATRARQPRNRLQKKHLGLPLITLGGNPSRTVVQNSEKRGILSEVPSNEPKPVGSSILDMSRLERPWEQEKVASPSELPFDSLGLTPTVKTRDFNPFTSSITQEEDNPSWMDDRYTEDIEEVNLGEYDVFWTPLTPHCPPNNPFPNFG